MEEPVCDECAHAFPSGFCRSKISIISNRKMFQTKVKLTVGFFFYFHDKLVKLDKMFVICALGGIRKYDR